jgi:hypothetical protein
MGESAAGAGVWEKEYLTLIPLVTGPLITRILLAMSYSLSVFGQGMPMRSMHWLGSTCFPCRGWPLHCSNRMR